ncbi:MAG TPA: hypothetical protein VMT16_05020, partial [Thermoanaerobaculia bacterium]|nr:hypothetical protein [Thermoanaerobaculia bacterium]
MRTRRPALVALLALPLAAATALAAPQVRGAVAAEHATVGDLVAVELEATLPAGSGIAALRLPEPLARWGEAEVVAAEALLPDVASDGPLRYRGRVTLRAFRPGPLDLPPLPLAAEPAGAATVVDPGLTTPPGLTLAIASVLPQGDEPVAPRPPAPPVALPLGARFWWTLGALAAACLLAGALLGRRRRPAAE